MLPVRLAELYAGDLGDCIGVIGRLQRAGQQRVFWNRLRRHFGIDAGRAQKQKLLDRAIVRRADDVGLDHQIVIEEIDRIAVVGVNAANLCRGQKHHLRTFAGKPVKNGGLVAIWATSADAQWNNWPFMRNFVPLVNETVNHLASGQTRGMENRVLEAGEAIVWSAPGKPAVQSVEVTLPDGTIDANKRPVLTNNRYEFRYNNAYLPGLYQLRFTPTEVQPQPVFYGVGIDRKELDPTTLSAKDLDHLVSAGYLDKRAKIDIDDIAGVIRNQNTGSDIWKWLALFVLLNLMAETWMTWRMVGLQKKVDVAGAGMAHPQPV